MQSAGLLWPRREDIIARQDVVGRFIFYVVEWMAGEQVY